MTTQDRASETRRTVLKTAGAVAASLFAMPAAASADPGNGKGGGGGGGGSDPSIDVLDVYATDDNTVEAYYEVSDPDGDLDKIALGVRDRNLTIGHDVDDIDGGEETGYLETDELEPGDYKWAVVVADEAKNADAAKGKVTV